MTNNAPASFAPLAEIKRGRGTLIVALLLGIVVSTTWAFLAPLWYEATLTVVTTTPSKSPMNLMNAAGLSDLPIDLNMGSSDTDRIQAVLRSRSVGDAVIEKFGLQQRYDERYIEAVREKLWIHCSTKLEKKSGSVALTCEDRDPNVAQQMVAYFGEIGNDTFHRVSASSAGEERRFLDRRVAQARVELETAAQNVREFQEKHKIIDLAEQSKAVVSAMASLKGEILSKQLQLSYLGSFSSADESSAVQLRQQVAAMESKLRSLEQSEHFGEATPPSASSKEKKSNGDIFPTAMSVPKLRFELEGLFRQEKIQETLFLLLTQRLELARINEARDTSAFQVLDPPVVPMHHARPKRVFIILTTIMAALLLALGWILFVPWWRYRTEQEMAEKKLS